MIKLPLRISHVMRVLFRAFQMSHTSPKKFKLTEWEPTVVTKIH